KIIESRVPMELCFDVLVQWINTLAISEGFSPEEIFPELISTHCFRQMTKEEWDQLMYFITEGGKALSQYDDYRKLEKEENEGAWHIRNRRIAMRHRLHIGTIVSEPMMKVRLITGGYVGVIEEYFISRLEPGDVFTLAGRNLEFVMIKEMTALVRKSKSKRSMVPSWQGGRMPLSANLGKKLRETLQSAVYSLQSTVGSQAVANSKSKHYGKQSQNSEHIAPPPCEGAGGEVSVGSRQLAVGSPPPEGKGLQQIESSNQQPVTRNYQPDKELEVLRPLFELQQQLSHVPKENELLIEQIETKDGFHLFVYPFEGRLVHEAMAAILAYRISRITPISFSFAMNDYGFELLSDQPIPVDDTNVYELFSPENLLPDIQRSVNSTEMARRKFRDIATIGGLIFQGYPGEMKKARHLQASASLLFNVFSEI
ncbi:MAG: DNA ligase-associated DEXH box helicase, partial [Chitinophagales bacterium]